MTLSIEEIQKEVETLEQESKALKKELFKLGWFMRGSMTLEQIYQTDIMDREIIADIIKENLETTKESGLPFF